MRDPARIDRVLEKLRAVWKANPDWRLGQLVVNTVGDRGLFYVEDDVVEERLDERLAAKPTKERR